MSLLTETEFRDLYVSKTATTVNSQQILEASRSAKVEVRNLVSAAAVTDAELDTPTNTERADAIRTAHYWLMIRALLPMRSTRFTDYGIQKSSRDANSQLTNSFLTPAEVRTEQASLMADVRNLLTPYFVAETSSISTIPVYRR